MTDQHRRPDANGEESSASTDDAEVAADATNVAVPIPPTPAPAANSETVGTGSYIALSCSVMALLVTFLILGILFLVRWL